MLYKIYKYYINYYIKEPSIGSFLKFLPLLLYKTSKSLNTMWEYYIDYYINTI